MTYEEKLDIVVEAIREAKQFTRKDCLTKLYWGNGNGLSRVGLDATYDILLQLQDDEKVIKVDKKRTSQGDFDQTVEIQEGTKNYFLIDVLDETFENWYETYLLNKKTSVSNLDYINMLRVYDVVLDINEQIQLTHKTTVYFPLIPSVIRYRALFPADTIGLRDEYCQNRLNSLVYLKEKGAIADFSQNAQNWDTTVTVSLVLSKFDDFYKVMMAEYVKRNKKEEEKKEIELPLKDKEVWTDDFRWNGNNFIFGKYGSISFTSKDRKSILKALTDKKGGWATITELKGDKNPSYVRSTIKQIEDRLPKTAKGHISIVSTQDDDAQGKPNAGAYRIKVQL
jgi:hypothetical protein